MIKLGTLAGGYKENSVHLRDEDNVFKPNENLQELEFLQFVELIKNKYIDNNLTKEEIENFINYFIFLYDPNIKIELQPLNYFLKTTILYIEGLFADHKILNGNLLILINNLQSLLTFEKPIKPKIEVTIKDKITNLSKGYTK